MHRDDVSGFIGDQRGVDSQHHGGICDCVHRLSPAHCQHRHRSACALLCNVHSGKNCYPETGLQFFKEIYNIS